MNPFDHSNLTHEGRVRMYRSIINNHGTKLTPAHYQLLLDGAPTVEDKAAFAEAWNALGLEAV